MIIMISIILNINLSQKCNYQLILNDFKLRAQMIIYNFLKINSFELGILLIMFDILFYELFFQYFLTLDCISKDN